VGNLLSEHDAVVDGVDDVGDDAGGGTERTEDDDVHDGVAVAADVVAVEVDF